MILVLGDVMTDVIVRPTGALAHGTDCPSAIVSRPGGSGANVACWLAHLGAPSALLARVGADLPAQEALLRDAGVVPHLVADAAPTGTIVAIIDPAGERSFYTDRGANLSLCAADARACLLDGADWLHVSGYALFAPGPRAAALALMAHARMRGVAFSIDAGSAAFLAQLGADAFRTLTQDAAICFANTAEAAILGPLLHTYGCRMVTRGAAGAEAWLASQHVMAAARPVAHPETTGAGDAALAGFLVARANGGRLEVCLDAAMRAAARAVKAPGARPSGVV
jgi:sugar/nucleoside kinase (ribokinase family)